MFNKLKEKLKSWTKRFAKQEEAVEEKPLKEKTKYIQPPKTFSPTTQKYEPDVEQAEEIVKEIISSTHNQQTPDLTESKPQKEKQGFFSRLKLIVTKVKITKEHFDIYAEELEMLLLENNVALEVTEKIIKELKEKIVGQELLKKEVETEIQDAFKEIIRRILVDPFNIVEKINSLKSEEKPFVILFCGINGTGKTTTIAKIAEYLKKNNLSCVLAAADTFRAASIEQLKKHGEKLKINVIAHEYGSDPASVGFDAVKYAKKNHIDAVLIDTAGRMHTSKNLMAEIEKISKVCKPNLKLFVGESITGNDVIEQVKSFNWAIQIDGIILTKADIDEKGGTALSVGYITKKPILFLGTGQEYDKIEVFDKEKFIKKLGLD